MDYFSKLKLKNDSSSGVNYIINNKTIKIDLIADQLKLTL